MPHRADYFVLAYSWDHHCGVLVESLKRRFEHVAAEVSGLERDELTGTEALLAYYKKWHYNNELYHLAMTELTSRQFVINSLGYRGYGVNRDLLKALGDLKERYRGLEASLIGGFYRKARLANQTVSLDGDTIDQRRSDRIIAKLAGKIGKNAADEIPRARKEDPFDLDHYFTVMSKETSWDVNTTIFRKMFFSVGSSSMTIMKGSTGLHNGLSCQELKLLANRNFVETGREIFSTLPAFTQIGIDVVKRIHLALSRG
ncbi:MAG: hypothetical protein ABSC19_16515, partial [Syntrophorhabdales bacterium]